MNNWFLRGLRAGVRTERLQTEQTVSAGLSQGMPRDTVFANAEEAAIAAGRCPTEALVHENRTVAVEPDRCVACMRCKQSSEAPAQEWSQTVSAGHAPRGSAQGSLAGSFRRSIHVRVVDAGDCGSCLNEIAQTNGPSYNLHRFGIFITPTPRQADVLLVVGPVTRQMIDPLRKTFDAMPEPKRVVAAGTCAASGGVFGPSLMCAGGVEKIIPVDLVVPGCPPPPWAIVHALRTICGQELLG